MGFDEVGKGTGTSCASIPLSIGTKVDNKSSSGTVVALGIGSLSTL